MFAGLLSAMRKRALEGTGANEDLENSSCRKKQLKLGAASLEETNDKEVSKNEEIDCSSNVTDYEQDSPIQLLSNSQGIKFDDNSAVAAGETEKLLDSSSVKVDDSEESSSEEVQTVESMDEKLARTTVTEEYVEQNRHEFYFHFTNSSNLLGIKRSGVLVPNTPSYRKSFGRGVYVSTLDPFSNSKNFLKDKFFLPGARESVKLKLQHFIAINKEDVVNTGASVKPYPGRDGVFKVEPPKSQNLPLYEIRHCFGNKPD